MVRVGELESWRIGVERVLGSQPSGQERPPVYCHSRQSPQRIENFENTSGTLPLAGYKCGCRCGCMWQPRYLARICHYFLFLTEMPDSVHQSTVCPQINSGVSRSWNGETFVIAKWGAKPTTESGDRCPVKGQACTHIRYWTFSCPKLAALLYFLN